MKSLAAQEIINNDIKEIIDTIRLEEIKKLSGSTILITGSNGLLGSYICDTIKFLNDNNFLSKPCKIIGINRKKISKESRNYHLSKNKNFVFIKHDISLPMKINRKIDYIFHAAGYSSPFTFQAHPLETIDVNIKGLRWLLDLAIEANIKSMLYFSSGEVYGSAPQEYVPTPETYNGSTSTQDPRACYIESKRLGETLCKIYADKYSVPVKVVRPFVIYGPGVTINDRKVLSDFMKYAINDKPIEMLSKGRDIRSDCYISDATICFWKVLFSSSDGEVFNVGHENDNFTIEQLAQTIHNICGIKVKPQYKGHSVPSHIQTAPRRFCPDMSKFRKTFGYEPNTNLKTGLTRTINWNKILFANHNEKN